MKKELALLQQLSAIEKLIPALAPAEQGNLGLDLEANIIRIKTAAYKESDYIQRNIWDMPRRIRDFFHCIRRYYSHALAWEKALSRYDLSRIKTILDICPGNGPKACLALYYLQYQGDLYNLDKDPEAAQMLELFINMLRPQYKQHNIQDDLFNIPVQEMELVLANHIVDDLLLDEYCKKEGSDIQELYENKDLFLKTIQEIKQTIPKESFAQKIVTTLDRCTARTADLVFCHYSGLVEESLQLGHWGAFCGEILELVIKKLLEKNYTVSSEKIDNGFYYFLHKQG